MMAEIVCNAIFVEGRQGYQMFLPDKKNDPISFSKSQNTYNYLAAVRFTPDYLKILNFET